MATPDEQRTNAIHGTRILKICDDLEDLAVQINAGCVRPNILSYRIQDLGDQLIFIAQHLATEQPEGHR